MIRRASISSICLLLGILGTSSLQAETSWQEWFEFNQSPEGSTMDTPVTLESHDLGENTEQHLAPDVEFNLWIQDETFFRPKQDDRIEVQKVLKKSAKTFKLDGVVEPIPFQSGQELIPEQYINRLRELLDTMKHRDNVRIHFIGHTDSDKLGPVSKAKYGDNIGLSRSRAEATAEFFQRELDLAPESVSYDGVGDSQPIASNDTPQGKARNRRVEVQIWYDEITESAVDEEVVIEAEKLNRIKVCRKETVCKLRYREGSAKRARLRNLVEPLRLAEGEAEIPAEFVRSIKEVLHNLRDKQNVVVRFVGHTDNLPLSDRQYRIYGNHTALSKARARRVALAMADVLNLSNTAVGSDGKGESRPVASNDTEKGRSLNRRVEVEFWHDDPFQQFSEDAQACPEQAAAETITLTYDPPSGPIRAIRLQQGQPIIPSGYTRRLKQLMDDISDRSNVRLSFTGYTDNKRLSRRTAMVYGDDIGLSTARAQKVMKTIQQEMGLSDSQVQFEGRGFVHSKDVANTGFVQFDSARVEVQIVYDELAILEEDEGLDITRIEREAISQNPYALNLMRITVDGETLHDPYRNIADLQRCTDVALEDTRIKFKFENLKLKPRLNITAWPNSVRHADIEATEWQENRVSFRMYSNYQDYIERAEVRIFKEDQSTRDEPLAVIALDKDGRGEWLAELKDFVGPTAKLAYLVRVYDKEGNFDETSSLRLWLLDEIKQPDESLDESARLKQIEKELLVGYGESHLQRQTIPLSGGTISVSGTDIPEGHTVWLAGRPLPVSEDGSFVSDEIFKPGLHTVEVAVLDKGGNGELFLRELELKKNDWFYVGIADITLAKDSTDGPARIVTQDLTHYNNELNTDGRLAFFLDGKFSDAWQLTASADTREGPIDEIFSNFMEKTPDALFRRIDPDYFYPTFGDDSTLEEKAPTSGKFYVRAQRYSDYVLWGNFIAKYTDTDLMHIDRGLYGLNGHYESLSTTSFGEKRLLVDGFLAEPGTISGRDEFRGTGGSLYFMRHQDVLAGSERVRIEVRDKDSGIVLSSEELTPALDYDIDYIQGRIVLGKALSSTARDELVVNNGALSGHPTYLVVRYEYTPGFTDLDDVAIGGRAHYWINDNVKLGITASQQEEVGNENTLNGVDVTLRKNAGTWVKLEVAQSEGAGGASLASSDGGFNFNTLGDDLSTQSDAGAYRIDSSLRFTDMIEGLRGNASFYIQNREAGYAAPGQLTSTDTQQYGGQMSMPLTHDITLNVKADSKDQQQSLTTESLETDVSYRLNEHWQFASGLRVDSREDASAQVAATQKQGSRTDVALEANYHSLENWTASGFIQGTANTTGNREDNNRVGVGGSMRVSERLTMDGELSSGDNGVGARLGTDYLMSDRTNVYLSYAMDNERADNGVRSRKGSLTSGMRSRYSDTTSVYAEERYSHGDVPTGLTHALGIELAPNDRWTYGASVEAGTLEDKNTAAETDRLAMGVRVGYQHNDIKYTGAIEFRDDTVQNSDLSETQQTTLLLKNALRYQVSPDWRLVGKLNQSDTDISSANSSGSFYDGQFREYVLGFGYRPVLNDRWNTLFKFTHFFNVPSTGQVTVENSAAEFIQKSNILSVDTIYDINQRWSLGGKYAYRLGQVAQDRANPEFFDSRASLYVVRADWHFVHQWDALVEYRVLDLPDAQDQKSGYLLGISRHVGRNIKLGVGYNFTDFSDDLTDLDFDSAGFFVNIVAKM